MEPIKLYHDLKDRVLSNDIESYNMFDICQIVRLMSNSRGPTTGTSSSRGLDKEYRKRIVHHFEIILALIYSHALEQGLDVKRNSPVYGGATFDGGRGVLYNNFVDLDPLLQMVIAEYVQSISFNNPTK